MQSAVYGIVRFGQNKNIQINDVNREVREMERRLSFQVGDWVQGETWDKQRIYGYAVKLEDPEDIMKVYVVDSVNKKLVGRMIRVLSKSFQKVPDSTVEEEAPLAQLIDLALLTKDEEWFEQLTEQVNAIKKQYS